MVLGSGIPDPGVKKAPDPGSGSATLDFALPTGPQAPYPMPTLYCTRSEYAEFAELYSFLSLSKIGFVSVNSALEQSDTESFKVYVNYFLHLKNNSRFTYTF
jgi:hypothetical protein